MVIWGESDGCYKVKEFEAVIGLGVFAPWSAEPSGPRAFVNNVLALDISVAKAHSDLKLHAQVGETVREGFKMKWHDHRLRIVDMEISCIVGILEEERVSPQRLILNAECEVDFEDAESRGVQMTRGVNYAEVAQFLKDKIISQKYGLLEELLKDCGISCLSKFNGIHSMHLKVSKPDILSDATVEAECRFSR